MTRAAFHEKRKFRVPSVASVHLSRPKAQVNIAADVRNEVSRVTIVIDQPLSVPYFPVVRSSTLLRKAQLRKIIKAVAEALERERTAANLGILMNRTNDRDRRGEAATSQNNRLGESRSDIDVSAAEELWGELDQVADDQGLTSAMLAKICFEHGLAIVSSRLWDESPRALLSGLLSTYDERFEGPMKLRSLNVSRTAYLEAVLLAQEQSISISDLVCLCLTAGLENHVVA